MRAPIDRPSLAWRAFVLIGIGSLKLLSLSDGAWDAWEENVTDAVPRSTVRKLLAGALVLHVVEAAVAHRWARRGGVAHRRSWTLTTLLYGFPELRLLRRRVGLAQPAAAA
ncbi:MAG: TMEM254 family protein [Acidimicrobiales bacterium]